MHWSVSETFEHVRQKLPRFLPDAGVERCAQIAKRVPDHAASHYIEFRLNGDQQVDFLSVAMDKGIVAQLEAQVGSDPSPVWAEHLTVLREWATDGAELSHAPFVWFEYDGGSRFVASEPEPSLAFGVEQDYLGRRDGGLRANDVAGVALGKVAFSRMLPDATRQSRMEIVDRCYAALSPVGAVPHAPVMIARDPVTVKPFVIMPRESMFPFLDQIGWPGSRRALAALLDTYYAPFRQSIYMDLTLTDRVEQRLGIATSQFQRAEADFSGLAWWRLPQELEGFKKDLEGWAGYSEVRMGGERVWIRRWLDTKAVLDGDKVEYKAYLGFSPARPPLFC
ncbi:MAG TPA: hypothetical protein VHB79_20745 [Polyangiaceae bacterium]|nr:hypothetical protein [Polyangiaceae bacterium]